MERGEGSLFFEDFLGRGELFDLSLFFPFEEEEEEDRSFSFGRTDAWASDGVVNPEKDSPEKDDGLDAVVGNVRVSESPTVSPLPCEISSISARPRSRTPS